MPHTQGFNVWNALWLSTWHFGSSCTPQVPFRPLFGGPALQSDSHRCESCFRLSNSGWCFWALQPSGWEIANSWSSGLQRMKAASQLPAAAAKWHDGWRQYLSPSATTDPAAKSADKSKSSREKWNFCQWFRQPVWEEMENIQTQWGIRCSVGNRWREMREGPRPRGWTVCFEVTNKNVRPGTAVHLWRWQICI